MLRETILVFAVLLAVACATQVYKCGSGEPIADTNLIKISGCDNPPCKLKRGTKATVEEKFVVDHDASDMKNSVYAKVLNVPLPFVGVDGTSACDNIFNEDGTHLESCTLKAGTHYVYKREFAILPIYPTLSLTIHYAMKDANSTIACFEVPAKITN
ncbi:Niemann-Pick type C-2b [Lasioglossum baleicum]|uniref:Niemann-Pick type C-2b n=1 Tax=Lasioglossum baleicum TaxID=434251 RepID=UPI003FCDCBC6